MFRKLTENILAIVFVIFAIALALFALNAIHAGATTNFTVDVYPNLYRVETFFSATTTNATSTNIASGGSLVISGAKKVTYEFSRSGQNGNAGASRFSVQVQQEPNGAWKDFNRLIGSDVSQTATSSVTISVSTTTVEANMNLDYGTYYATRCVVREFTDGEHTCAASAQF